MDRTAYVTASPSTGWRSAKSTAMIDGMIGNKLLPANIRQDIVERTDGIPLFVEEMTKAVMEAESEGRPSARFNSVPSAGDPASLQASLMARLDRLGPAKEVAQVGAAIGREFSQPYSPRWCSKPEAELASALRPSDSAGLLFRRGAPHASYCSSTPWCRTRRIALCYGAPRALHARIAESLESQFTEIAESQPELRPARHCTEAGLH